MAKSLLVISMLSLLGLAGGCHYGSYDDHRGYGSSYRYSGSSGGYREGFREGRAYERRRSGRADNRYDDRYWR
jgi:hypothetical protein